MKLSKREILTGYALVLPLLIGCAVFYAVPFAVVAWFSLVKGSGHSQSFAGLGNYLRLFENEIFRLAWGNTFRFLALGLTLTFLLGFAIAHLLKAKTAGSRLLRTAVMLPYIMPVVGAVLLTDVLFTETGLMNGLMNALGLPVQDWLSGSGAFWVVLGLYLWKNTGYSAILLLSGLVTVPGEHYDASALDGAGKWRQLIHVTVPQMWYSIFFSCAIALLNAFRCFREILLIGGDQPHSSIYMLQHFINNSFSKLSYSKMTVASMLFILALAAVFGLCYRFVLRKEAYKE